MSRTSRTPRAKSSGVRPLGAMRLMHSNPGVVRTKNDPALHINQIRKSETEEFSPQPTRDLAKEREYQIPKQGNKGKIVSDVTLRSKNQERERKLRDQISALQNQILQLKQEIKQKNDLNHQLHETLSIKEKEHEGNLLQCEERTTKVQQSLEESRSAEREAAKQLEITTLDFEEKLKKIIEEYERKLSDLAAQKDKELKEKDEKMVVLKKRMAESLGKNSAERQQQLEELKRDLIKQSQEAKELQHKLKYFQQKPKPCENCTKLEEKLEEKILQIRLKEKTINDLQGIGRKMQLQLHQQHRHKVMKEEQNAEKHRMLCKRAGIKIAITSHVSHYQFKKQGSLQQKKEL